MRVEFLGTEGDNKVFKLKQSRFENKCKLGIEKIVVEDYSGGVAIISVKANSLGIVKEMARIALELIDEKSNFNKKLNQVYEERDIWLKEIILDFGNDILVPIKIGKSVQKIYDEYWELLKQDEDDEY